MTVGFKNGAAASTKAEFDVVAFLESVGVSRTPVRFKPGDVIFAQGASCKGVMYLQSGKVQLSVLSKTGRHAALGTLSGGDFFGEGCLAGQPSRMSTATAKTGCSVVSVPTTRMRGLLQRRHAMSDRFIKHILARNVRLEVNLVDQLFNSIEKRLARTLLLMAQYGKNGKPTSLIPKVSSGTLSNIVGTTQPRVRTFLRKFERLGFVVSKNDRMTVHHSLLNVVLHD